MVKTQIQLPDELYREVKRFAAKREWSMAETFRRGAERLISLYPQETDTEETWAFPPPGDCGPFLAPPERWTELAHED
ncbi:MAG: antitoxin [Verrucomicrobiota bacterium]